MIENFAFLTNVIRAEYPIAQKIKSDGILRVVSGTSADGQDEKEKELLSLLVQREEEIGRKITFKDLFECGLFCEPNSNKWKELISKIKNIS